MMRRVADTQQQKEEFCLMIESNSESDFFFIYDNNLKYFTKITFKWQWL